MTGISVTLWCVLAWILFHGKAIASVEAVLKALRLGVPTWEQVTGHQDENGNYWSRDIGYTLSGDNWGLSLRSRSGNEFADPDTYREEVWGFNDAPHWMRIQAIGKIADLLDTPIKRTDETTKQIQTKTPEVQEVAAALKSASEEW